MKKILFALALALAASTATASPFDDLAAASYNDAGGMVMLSNSSAEWCEKGQIAGSVDEKDTDALFGCWWRTGPAVMILWLGEEKPRAYQADSFRWLAS